MTLVLPWFFGMVMLATARQTFNVCIGLVFPFNIFSKHVFFFWFYFWFLFIYLFLAVLGLRCCARAFSSCGEHGLLFVAVHGLLIVMASLVAEHRL